MSAITSDHYLLKGQEAVAEDRKRSSYSYLFPNLADAPDAGCFTGTDDQTSIQRLKDFETCFHPAFGAAAAPVLTIALPAAYTYFGQFVNHDISAPIGGLRVDLGTVPPAGIIGTADPAGLDKVSRGTVATILRHFANEHADPLTLGSLYGDCPASPDRTVKDLYEEDGRRFRLGKTVKVDDAVFSNLKKDPATVFHAGISAGIPAPDILRANRLPQIADRRNDGNLILCQLHLAFMLVHNKAVAAFEQMKQPPADVFDAARQLVTRHYHWLILNDFLPSLLSKTVLARPLAQWVPRKIAQNTVPMEFTTAAFRFGHSMVGRTYDFNANFGQDGSLSPSATFADLFNFTSAGNMNDPAAKTDRQLPDHWVIDWDRMTRPPQPVAAGARPPGGAEQIDLAFAPDMLDAAGDATVAEHGSILFRNLLRGFHRRMPFGQHLAEACNVDRLSPESVRAALAQPAPAKGDAIDVAAVAERLGFLTQTPAWLYFLCEAKILERGLRVGPTASHIIADTITALMRDNPGSVLNYKAGSWTPGQSALKTRAGTPLESIRAFLLFATEPG